MSQAITPEAIQPAAAARPARAAAGQKQIALRLAGLEGIVGLHLGIGHSLLVGKLEPQLKPLGLTAKQVTILWLAEANPDLTQIELSRFLEIERATIHQFTRSLVGNGMIDIVPHPTDRRATTLRPTPLGTAKLAEARAIIARHETEATSALSPIERRLLLELLMKLHGAARPD
ncbi:MarR family winged helix-turn-helix transcriptional regulator [Novosphingobium sp. B 225]|uniref:MarR family winged helix-turn-helix transcriptional regulator n=1 Tax=Novosphingobium sp. B 225 TaxID=1961849 RepID=UPI001595C60B|nr:MarR family transcriptional regulator [Novosphingobium sp. B 225]